MADGAERQAQTPAHAGAFDVRRWLTQLTGIDGWEINRTRTRGGVEFVTSYSAADGAIGEVALHALPSARHPSWELLADAAGRQERIVIPARTHLDW